MGAPVPTPATHNNITPESANSYGEEVMIMVTPRKVYYLTRMEEGNFISPTQETCQSTSAETVF